MSQFFLLRNGWCNALFLSDALMFRLCEGYFEEILEKKTVQLLLI